MAGKTHVTTILKKESKTKTDIKLLNCRSVYLNRYFDDVSVCNLTADSLEDDSDDDIGWKLQEFHGKWIKGVNAGGCINPDGTLAWLGNRIAYRQSCHKSRSLYPLFLSAKIYRKYFLQLFLCSTSNKELI